MGRDRKPKHKLSRREGRDLFGTGGASLERRPEQPPGMHGRRRTRQQDCVYAEQLREKQKVKRMYGQREDQFRRLLDMALQSREPTGVALLKLLERRLGLARTRLQARQFVTHGHVRVNGDWVNIPSALVRPGEEIQMDDSLSQIPDLRELRDSKPVVPPWLEKRDHGGLVLREPNREEIDPDIQKQRVVEFYSR